MIPHKNAPNIAAVTMLSELANNPNPVIVITATMKLEPELIPKTYGPAKGFWNNVCINNPLVERQIPTNTAEITLGNLNILAVTSEILLESKLKMLLKISLIDIFKLPILKSNIIAKISTSKNAAL